MDIAGILALAQAGYTKEQIEEMATQYQPQEDKPQPETQPEEADPQTEDAPQESETITAMKCELEDLKKQLAEAQRAAAKVAEQPGVKDKLTADKVIKSFIESL